MMKNTNKSLTLLLILSALLQSPMIALAKEPPANLEPLEEFTPPAITNEEQQKPEITVIKKEGETVEEYRINGQLYMMKVTPAHGVPYYMHKEDQNGGWMMDGPNQPISIPKWTIFRF